MDVCGGRAGDAGERSGAVEHQFDGPDGACSLASYDEMFAEVKLKNGKGTGYGLGVEVGTRNGHRYVAHGGEVSGFVAQNMVYPDDKAAVTVLTNEDASSAAGALARKDCSAGAGWRSGVPVQIAMRGGGEAGSGDIYGIAGGEAGPVAVDYAVRAYFTAEAWSDFAMSLKPLGAPTSFTQTLEVKRGGMTFRVFDVTFPTKQVRVTVYEMPDGKAGAVSGEASS